MKDLLQDIAGFFRKLFDELSSKRPRVPVIRFSGIIADTGIKKQSISHYRFSKAIEKAFDKSGAVAVA